MLDIHTHILPGIDDGASTIEDSKAILELEKNRGVRNLVLTPHFKIKHPRYKNNTKEVILAKYNEFMKDIKDMDINIYPGCEIRYDKEILNLLKENKLLGINDSNYLLIEFSKAYSYEEASDDLYNITRLGYNVIIAHVERYNLWLTYDNIVSLKKEGYYIQVNGDSLLKLEGKECYNIAKKLLKNNIIDYIATDAHKVTDIPTKFKKIDKIIKKHPNINSYTPFLD